MKQPDDRSRRQDRCVIRAQIVLISAIPKVRKRGNGASRATRSGERSLANPWHEPFARELHTAFKSLR